MVLARDSKTNSSYKYKGEDLLVIAKSNRYILVQNHTIKKVQKLDLNAKLESSDKKLEFIELKEPEQMEQKETEQKESEQAEQKKVQPAKEKKVKISKYVEKCWLEGLKTLDEIVKKMSDEKVLPEDKRGQEKSYVRYYLNEITKGTRIPK